MKLITRDTDYAIQALCCIAKEKKRLVSAGYIVKNLRMPRPFLRKILQVLNKKGLLRSTKGKGGGFVLARSPQKIFVSDIMRIFQGPPQLNECKFRKSECPQINVCVLREKISKVEKHMLAEMKTISIASLL